MKTGLKVLGGLCLLAASCGSMQQADGEEQSSIRLNLSTAGVSGTEYRLGPAAFDIYRYRDDPPYASIEAEGSQRSLHVPVEPDYYRVVLRPGWTLSRIEGNVSTPVLATLTSPAEQSVRVIPYEASPVNYAFHLGETGLDIGVTVDEGIPAGYDGRIVHSPGNPTQFMLEWRDGGGVCCYASVAEAQAAYANAKLLPPQD